MNRRNFLGMGLAATVVASSSLSAIDFRKTKPKSWEATKTDAAIKELYGTSKLKESKEIKLKAPDIAENGAVIPVTISTKLNAQSIAIFQDANPESTVAVFTLHKNSIADYSIRIKMRKTGTVTVVANVDGVLHSVSKQVKVTIGGCGG